MSIDLDDPGDPGDPGDRGEADYELIEPTDFLPDLHFPSDARRLGINQYTGDTGALVVLAAALDGSKRSHRAVAWLLLVVVLIPVVTTVWAELH